MKICFQTPGRHSQQSAEASCSNLKLDSCSVTSAKTVYSFSALKVFAQIVFWGNCELKRLVYQNTEASKIEYNIA